MSNGKNIHTNILMPSTQDDIGLGLAVENRFVEVLNLYLRLRGVALVPPKDMDDDVKRWREMRIRHKKGDFRNTEDEMQATKRIAQWTVDVNAKLRNQESQTLTWKD